MSGRVVAVARAARHRFSKQAEDELRITAGLGVDGDAHQGVTVRHRSRVAVDPTRPNLRQVHLIHGELFDELAEKGFTVRPGELGENITTRGIALLALPRGALLRIGESALLEVTGLRNPCAQIERFQPGLLAALLDTGADGAPIRKAGIMTIAVASGIVRPGNAVELALSPEPHLPLERV